MFDIRIFQVWREIRKTSDYVRHLGYSGLSPSVLKSKKGKLSDYVRHLGYSGQKRRSRKMNDKLLHSILVVEDEEDIQNLMCLHLSREGYQVDFARTGKSAYNMLSDRSYHLIILDWMIPDISGLDLLKWMREPSSPYKNTPVLFVTAKSHPDDIVLGLETGADDYITKPFDFSVFKARVKNLMKRLDFMSTLTKSESPANLQLGDLTLDTNARRVFIKGNEVILTFSEFCLLEILLRNQGKALSRKQMISFIQGEDVNVTSRTIDTHIFLLRKKLGECGKFIETVRGIGYRMGFV